MKERLHGLDLIRLISFFAIATFHVSLIHYNTPEIAISSESLIIRAVDSLARLLSFSGFTIAFLSSLLTAFSGSSVVKRMRLFGFLLAGWVVFSALIAVDGADFFVWDVYPLIFTGLLVASVAEYLGEKVLTVLGLTGFVLLFIPIWDYAEYMSALPYDLRVALGFGSCPHDIVEWPVLPWIGLPWFGYWCGYRVRRVLEKDGEGFFRFTRSEVAFWGAGLAASFLAFGDFYGIRLGPYFACEAYRQPPLVFWGHFIWPLFLIRLSFEPEIRRRLAGFRIMRMVSSLMLNRKFWLAYFTNYLFAHFLSWLVTESGVEETRWNVPVIAFIAVMFLPMTEILVRGLVYGWQWGWRWVSGADGS